MRIFLSHALVDKQLAEQLKRFLSGISLGLIDSWLSTSLDGLKPGDVLWDEIHEQLQTSDKIIVLLTPNSYLRPWLFYESGYIAGNKGACVIPLLFGISSSNLPSPLSAYVMYSGNDRSDLVRLSVQLLSQIVPNPNMELIESQVQCFQEETKEILRDLSQVLNGMDEQQCLDGLNIKMIDKLKASEIFHRKIADPSIERIVIITYTNEVEAGAISRYRVQGKKSIEIFKRSIFADLSEQQRANVMRLAQGSAVKKWNKFKISFQASKILQKEFEGVDDVKITQYFYDSPPAKRAYLFDDDEAIIAHYENADDLLQIGGSLYKGMNKSKSLWVTGKTEIGRLLINEIKQHVRSLKASCRAWEDEEARLKDSSVSYDLWQPHIRPKAVFLDLDGVLYDSLPKYVIAWKEGFKKIGIDFPETEVYRFEGMPGKATVENYLSQKEISGISIAEIDAVVKRKSEMLEQLGPPEVQEGARSLVSAIQKSKLAIWIVTGSTKPSLREQVFRDFGGTIPSENIISGDDYEIGKPSPVPYLIAIKKARIESHEAIVIENSPLGIESANKSGAFCIAVNTGILDNRELQSAGVKAIFPSCSILAESWPAILEEFVV